MTREIGEPQEKMFGNGLALTVKATHHMKRLMLRDCVMDLILDLLICIDYIIQGLSTEQDFCSGGYAQLNRHLSSFSNAI